MDPIKLKEAQATLSSIQSTFGALKSTRHGRRRLRRNASSISKGLSDASMTTQSLQGAYAKQDQEAPVIKEPTVISTEKGKKKNKENKNKLDDMKSSLKGKEPAESDLPSEVQDELDAFNTSKEEDLLALNEEKIAVADSDAAKAEIKKLEEDKKSILQETEQANMETEAALTNYGLANSYSRYSPQSFKAAYTSVVKAGKKKIQDYDKKYTSAIAEAERLFDRNELVNANKKLNEIIKIKQDAAEEVKKQQEELDKLNKEETERQNTISRDLAIADLIQSGKTDPAEIMKTLQTQGFSGTSKEISDAIKNLSNGAGGDLGTDMGMLNYAKQQGWISKDASIFDFWTMKRNSTTQPQKTTDGLPNNIVTQIDKLSSSFDSSPIVKQFNEVLNKKLGVEQIVQTEIKGPADLALVFDFMKALDPSSVVREAEYDTASKSGNIFAGALAKFNGYLKSGGGFLPDNVREEFLNIINKKYGAIEFQYDNLKNEVARKINKKTGSEDGGDYLTDYKGALDFVESLEGGEVEAEEKLKSVYNQYGSQIDSLLEQNPDITNSEILQILGV
jgi:hypothetical protein